METVYRFLLLTAFVLCVAAVVKFFWLVHNWLVLRLLRNRVEDFFIVGDCDGAAPDLGRFADLAEIVPAATVQATAKDVENMIKRSGNPTDCAVLHWQYRYGEHCNESPEEYAARVCEGIAKRRQARHKKWAQGDAQHYQTWVMQQQNRSYEWDAKMKVK